MFGDRAWGTTVTISCYSHHAPHFEANALASAGDRKQFVAALQKSEACHLSFEVCLGEQDGIYHGKVLEWEPAMNHQDRQGLPRQYTAALDARAVFLKV